MNEDIICRGSLRLGNACGTCTKCRNEIKKWAKDIQQMENFRKLAQQASIGNGTTTLDEYLELFCCYLCDVCKTDSTPNDIDFEIWKKIVKLIIEPWYNTFLEKV